MIWGLLFAVAVYGAYFIVGGTKQIAEQLESFSWFTFALACALSLCNYGLRFVKWEYYLAVLGIRGIPKWESLITFLSGFVLTITPGKVGEVFKSVVLHETRGIDLIRSGPIVVAERLTDLIGVIGLIALGSLSIAGGTLWAAAGAMVVVGILLFVTMPVVSRTFLAPWARLPGRLGQRLNQIIPKVEAALDSLRELVRGRRLIWPSVLSLAGWSLEGVGVYVLLHGFGVNARLLSSAFSYATATLAGALVPVPGGLGVTEAVLEETMIRAGAIPSDIARAAMLLSRLATLWLAVLVGFIALAILKRVYPKLFTSRKLDKHTTSS